MEDHVLHMSSSNEALTILNGLYIHLLLKQNRPSQFPCNPSLNKVLKSLLDFPDRAVSNSAHLWNSASQGRLPPISIQCAHPVPAQNIEIKPIWNLGQVQIVHSRCKINIACKHAGSQAPHTHTAMSSQRSLGYEVNDSKTDSKTPCVVMMIERINVLTAFADSIDETPREEEQ